MLGHKGSSLPGLLALKIYPDILKVLSSKLKRGIIAVTGTNGKTTTNNMIADIMRFNNYKVICNKDGSNMISGVTTAFVLSASFTGAFDYEYAVLEIDEASFSKVTDYIQPEIVVVNNFFRDQLDRYGELDKTISVIQRAVKKLKNTLLVINADDPLAVQVAFLNSNRTIYFGIAEKITNENNTVQQTREARFCPLCKNRLRYDFYHYSQLGSYSCINCDFRRPNLNISASEVNTSDKISAQIFDEKENFNIELNMTGLYNLYNALAASAVARLKNIEISVIQKALFEYKTADGRMEAFVLNGKPIFLNLVKNPTGFNEGIMILEAFKEIKNIFIAVNDNDADGLDISWLWDVDFEFLADKDNISNFICSGKRAEEMALRLKYAGVPVKKIKVIKDLKQAVDTTIIDNKKEISCLFATYTVLWPVRRYIKASLKNSKIKNC